MNNRVAEFRNRANLSQTDLAKLTDISLPYIKNIENPNVKTNVSIGVAYKLAKYFDTTIEILFNLGLEDN